MSGRRAAGLRLLTLNVNGLTARKAPHLLHYLVEVCGQPDIVCLQELKLSDASQLEAALVAGRGSGLPYHAVCASSMGTSHSKGVAVLASLGSSVSVVSDLAAPARDAEGRVVRVDMECFGTSFSVASVYAPNAGHAAFFNSLDQYLPTDRPCLLGGDFNCILDGQLDQTNNGRSRLAGAPSLKGVMERQQLVDALRVKYPNAGVEHITHFDTHRSSAARLDRWLMPQQWGAWVSEVKVVWGAPGDHAGVLLELRPPSSPSFGPGLRCFPVHVLYDEQARLQLIEQVEAAVQRDAPPPQRPAPPHADWQYWQVLKGIVLDAACIISRSLMRQRIQQRAAAEATLQRAASAAAATPSSPGSRAAYFAAVKRLQQEVYAESSRLAYASAAIWRDHGEKCTAWHFRQVGPNFQRSSPPLQFVSEHSGVVFDLRSVQSGAALTPLVSEFFSSASPVGLYRPGPTNPEAQQTLLAGVAPIADVQARQRAEGPALDGRLTAQCLQSALKSCANGKAPGIDGLPYEVYKMLWDLLSPHLLAALDDIFTHGPPDESWAHGVLVLVYKGQPRPKDQLSHQRPLTKQNTDIKLAQRAISDRMQPLMAAVIDPAQTAFIRGRWIGDNVLLRLGLAEYLKAVGKPGVILSMDIKKAYDRVDRGWLLQCAEAYGLPTGMRRWISLFMTQCTARVQINGWLTGAFPVDNGLPQGGPLAPLLWVLQLDPLTRYLRRLQAERRLFTPSLPNGLPAPPITHHADDSPLILESLHRDYPAALEAMQLYTGASNSEWEEQKLKGQCLGTHPDIQGRDSVTGADFGTDMPDQPRQPAIFLGIPSTDDYQLSQSLVFGNLAGRLRGAHQRWRPMGLSAVGRALTAKQVMSNSLCYHAMFLRPTTAQLQGIRETVTDHLTQSRLPEDRTLWRHSGHTQPLPTMPVACLGRHQGGLCCPDTANQVLSLQSKVVAALFSPGDAPWKALMSDALQRAASPPALGLAWVVLPEYPLPDMSLVPARVRDVVSAFRASQPQPMPHDERRQLPLRALLLMPLFYNRALLTASGTVFVPPAVLPAGWPFLLGQLAACPQVLRADALLSAVEAALPERWRHALRLAEAGEAAIAQHDDSWVSADGQWVRQLGPDGGYQYSAPRQDGSLAAVGPPPPPAAPATVWLPAALLSVPKHRSLWSDDEAAAYQQAHPRDRPGTRPMEYKLLGPWQHVQVYPAAWGHGGVPLHQYTCASARQRLTQLAAQQHVAPQMPDFALDGPLRPVLWPGPAAATVPTGLAQVEAAWLAEHARHVRRQRLQDGARRAAAAAALCPPPLPAWMRPRSPDYGRPVRKRPASDATAALVTGTQPRPAPPQPPGGPSASAAPSSSHHQPSVSAVPPPGEPAQPPHGGPGPPATTPPLADPAAPPALHPRTHQLQLQPPPPQPSDSQQLAVDTSAHGGSGVVLGDPSPAGGDGPRGAAGGEHRSIAKFWELLWDLPVSNSIKVFAVRYMHASLPCAAMEAAHRSRQDCFVHCRACARDVAPPLAIPSETYTHLFLDCPSYRPALEWLVSLWEKLAGERPPLDVATIITSEPQSWQPSDAARLPVWHALRLTVLHSIWSVRCAASDAVPCAASVVRLAIRRLTEEVHLQYRRARQRVAMERALPPAVLATQRQRPSKDGFAAWQQLGLCVELPPSVPGGLSHLVVLLSSTYPVPAPADPP